MAASPASIKRTGQLLIQVDGADDPVEVGTLELDIPITYTADSLRLHGKSVKNPA